MLELLRQGLPGLQAVYHFGSSAAQGAEHEGSDVDLAVLPEGPLSPLTRFVLAGACARRLHREVDLVDLASASTVLAEQVIESGRLLYARNPAAVAGFEVAVLGKHCQLNEERRELLADIQQRGGSMADEVVLAKAEIIERCLRRIGEEYAGRPENLYENWTQQDSILLNLERACQASIDSALRLIRLRRLGGCRGRAGRRLRSYGRTRSCPPRWQIPWPRWLAFGTPPFTITGSWIC